MKTMNIKYQKLVSAAISITKDIKNSKIAIADLAIKACKIKLGGQLVGFYSLTNFADDIGVNRKTLSTWVHARKIQKTLKKQNINVETENQLNKIAVVMKSKGNGTHNRVEKYSDTKLVLEAHAESNSLSVEDVNIKTMLTTAKLTHFRIDSYVLSELNQDELKSIMLLLTKTVTKLRKHFGNK